LVGSFIEMGIRGAGDKLGQEGLRGEKAHAGDLATRREVTRIQ